MIRRLLTLAFLFVLAVLLGGQTQQAAQSESAVAGAGPQAKTPEEHEAYVAFYQETDSSKKLEMGSAFLNRFATSEFKPNVFLLLVQSLLNAKEYSKVVEWGERFLNDFPEHGSKRFVFQAVMTANQELNQLPQAVEYAERLLQVDPANLSAIYTIPFILSERAVATSEDGRKQELARAADIAGQGLAMAKPSHVTDEQWTQYQAALHSSLGLIHLNSKEYAKAQAEYAKATSIIKNDPILYFRAGLAYSFDRKYDEAIDLLAKSVYLKGITEIQAKTELERVYRIKNGVTATGPELQAALQKLVEEAATRLK